MEICTVAICCIKFMSAVLCGEFQFFVKQCLTLFRRLLTFLLLYRYFCNHFFSGLTSECPSFARRFCFHRTDFKYAAFAEFFMSSV